MVKDEAMNDAGAPSSGDSEIIVSVEDLGISYNGVPALQGVTLDVRKHEIFGIIGPANSGKTSFLKALNRMNEFNAEMTVFITR